MTLWDPKIKDTPGPTYLAITNALEKEIRSGKLPPGTRLPPQRDLADQLNVSVTTITRAFAAAVERGLVVGEVGRGTFVRMTPPVGEVPWPHESHEEKIIDFGPNFPCLVVDDKILSTTLSTLSQRPGIETLMQYQPEGCHPAHMASGAEWLSRLGVKASPDDVIVTCGALHAGYLSMMVLTTPGDLVLVEELTSPAIKGICNMLKLRLRGVAIDEEGILPGRLESILRKEKAKVLYMVPNLHNPTASVLPQGRREEIAEIAVKNGVFIIEDDVYGALLENRPDPLVNIAPSSVCYVTSLSKAVAPGLRTGYLLAPLSIRKRALAALRITTWMAPPLLGQVASNWIADGTADKLLKLQKKETAHRQSIANEILSDYDFKSNVGGLHLWLDLPDPWRSTEFASELQERSVIVTPSENFITGRRTSFHSIRICLGATRLIERMKKGLQIISETAGKFTNLNHRTF